MSPSKSPYIMIRAEKEAILRFQKIADSKGTSMSKLGKAIIMEYIEKEEKKEEPE